jgi:hypothetical protein
MREAVRDVLKNNNREIDLLSLEPNRTCELLEKMMVVQFLPDEWSHDQTCRYQPE